jgi:hypothetical protein
MEFVADSVEVGLETGIGAEGRGFRPAITTVESLDELAPAADAAVTASSALATQHTPNAARKTMTNFRMLFYPDPMAISPANAKGSVCRRCNQLWMRTYVTWA